MGDKLLNIGPKSAAWLRQVGVRTIEDLKGLGAMAVFMKVKRAGFRPSLNLLYALAGAEQGRHWASLSPDEKSALVAEATALSDAVDLAKKKIYPMRDVTPPRPPEAADEASAEPTFLDDPDSGESGDASPAVPEDENGAPT